MAAKAMSDRNFLKTTKKMKLRKTKRSLLSRMTLDGFQEYAKAEGKYEKAMWIVSILFLYICSVYLAIATLNRYSDASMIVDVQDHPNPSYRFPGIMVCQASAFNKTFLEEHVQIPEPVEHAFAAKGKGRTDVVQDFARYLKLFNPSGANTVGDFTEEEWRLLTEMYTYNFLDQQFAGFVSDAAFRGNQIFRKCEFEKRPYKCVQIPFVVGTPSCHILVIEGSDSNVHATLNDTASISGLSFEVSLPSKDIYFEYHNNDNYETIELGVALYLSGSPSPFQEMLTFPGNSHAMVELQSAEVRLASNCYHTPPALEKSPHMKPVYSRDGCLFELVQNNTRKRCGCVLIGALYFPNDQDTCTPAKVKECSLKLIDETIPEYFELTRSYCKPLCTDYQFSATVSYYSIESDNNSHMTNRFNIFYHSKRQYLHVERSVFNWYEIVSNIGGLIGVYTGLSIAAAAQTIVLLGLAGWKAAERSERLRSSLHPLPPHLSMSAGNQGRRRRRVHPVEDDSAL